jgi:hypothetical protein
MGDGVVVLHGFPILSHGTTDMALARGILDIEHWLGTGDTTRDIKRTRSHCIHITFGTTLEKLSDGGTDLPRASASALAQLRRQCCTH